VNDRRANVYENKGTAFQGLQKSWNVIENKGNYALKPGILLKTSMLADGVSRILCALGKGTSTPAWVLPA
jgi:hypothetical protein